MPKAFNPATEIPGLTNKVVLVTGGNAGIGAAIVRALAPHNPECIYLCTRRRSSGDEVVKAIHQEQPDAKVEVLELDLNSFESVRKCAAEFERRSERLDLLFLNAGISTTKAAMTEEGFESQFGVNHMGHALLTQLLMPQMLKTSQSGGDVRIMVTSSEGIRFAPKTGLALDQMKTDGEIISSLSRYGHSKLANVLFAKGLAQHYPSILSTSWHPGVVNSEIWGKSDGAPIIMKLISPIVWLRGVPNEEGAKTGLWCATAEQGRDGVENGKFYFPIGVEHVNDKNVKSEKLRDELWQWTTEELAQHGGPGWPQV